MSAASVRRITGSPQLTPTSVADQAVRHLRQMLFAGELAPGSELADTQIAAELGIARPTVRMAVQRLVAEGLLTREPGRSARVRDFSADDIRDIYRVRRLVETDAVRQLVTAPTPLPGVEEALSAIRAAGDSWAALAEADVAFHAAIVEASGSARLTQLFESLSTEMRLVIGRLQPRYDHPAELHAEHAALLDALRAGDLEQALRLWQAHTDDAERFLLATHDRSDR